MEKVLYNRLTKRKQKNMGKKAGAVRGGKLNVSTKKLRVENSGGEWWKK